MKNIQKICLSSEEEIKDFAEKHYFQGSGSQKDPLIFSKSFAQPIIISNSNLFITFKNCILSNLSLRKSGNIVIQAVELRGLKLFKNSALQINTTKINKFVLRKSSQVNVTDCKIEIMDLVQSFENSFQECKFGYVENFYSRGNVFEKNEFEFVDLKNLIYARLPRIYLISLTLFPIFLTGMLNAYFNNNIIYFIMLSAFFPFTYIAILTVFIAGNKKAKKYEPNKIF